MYSLAPKRDRLQDWREKASASFYAVTKCAEFASKFLMDGWGKPAAIMKGDGSGPCDRFGCNAQAHSQYASDWYEEGADKPTDEKLDAWLR